MICLAVNKEVDELYGAGTVKATRERIGKLSKTMARGKIELNQLPEKLSKKLPKHPISAALIGRLAVAKLAQRNEVGRILLADAIKRTMAISNEIAIYAMVVDAINEKAKSFYQQYGFKPFCDRPRRLFLTLKSLRP